AEESRHRSNHCRCREEETLMTTLVLAAALLTQAQEPPTDWVDPDTGHRVVRLSTQPGSASLYFNYNGYTSNGSRLLFSTPDGISAVDEIETGAAGLRRE